LDRRHFLRTLGLGGLGLAGSGLTPILVPMARAARADHRVSQTRPALGTFVTLMVMTTSQDRALEGLAVAWQEIDRLTAVFSRYDPATPLSALNEHGLVRNPPPELVSVLRKSVRLHRASGGAFDVSVAPLVDLRRRFAFKKGVGPSGREIQRALALIDAQRIRIEPKAIRLLTPGMGLTLDGIAKGYIADAVSALLTRRGLPRHLIEAGGDIRVGGPKDGSRPWVIGVRDPSGRRRLVDVIHLRRGAAATSGGYENFNDCAQKSHHLIDPARGLSPQDLVSLTVIAPTAALADSLATAGFIMGPRPRRALIQTRAGCASLAVTRRGELIRAGAWPGPQRVGAARDLELNFKSRFI
jgi:thiamine biosynthesis lipoprotein